MLLLTCLIVTITLFSWAVGQLRGDLLSRGMMKCLLLPALIPDAIARTVTCLTTATPIHGLSPVKDGEPLLLEGECKVKRLALPLGSFLRAGLLVAASLYCVLQFTDLSAAIPSPESLEFAAQRGPGAFFHLIGEAYAGVSSLEFWTLLAVLMLAAMTLAAGLRTAEAAALFVAGGALVGVMQVADWVGFRLGIFSNGWFLQRFYEAELCQALILLSVLSLTMTSVLLLLHAVPASVGRLRPRPVSHSGHLLTRS